jgi:hypothetical protein
MTDTITFEQAKEALARAVAERGRDYAYPTTGEEDDEGSTSCVYRWEQWQAWEQHAEPGEPACGVGLALHHLGILDDVVPEKRGSFEMYENNTVAVTALPLDADLWAMRLFALFQISQDGGAAWGPAFDQALERVGREMAAQS